MKRVVLWSSSATMRRLLARSEPPVSVTSTMASASRGGLTSVAPQLNSTLADTPWAASHRRAHSTNSVATHLARPPPAGNVATPGGYPLPPRVLGAPDRRVFGHTQAPLARPVRSPKDL